MIVSTEAICLHSRKYGESSKIATLFSKDEGLVKVIAKGARKTKSKFGSSLDPLTYCNISYYKKPNRDLQLLSKAEIHIPLRKIHYSMDSLLAGLLILESISQSQRDNDINPELFGLLADALIYLNKSEKNPFSIFVAFQLNLAAILGFGIDMSSVGDALKDNYYARYLFSLENGSLYNAEYSVSSHSFMLNKEILLILENIYTLDLENTFQVEILDKDRAVFCKFFSEYFSFHLDKRFSFRSFELLNM